MVTTVNSTNFSMFCSFKEANGHVFASSLTASITLRNHAPQSYVTRLALTLSDLDMMIILSAAR